MSKALEIAAERYAKGEISKDEFEEIKASLQSSVGTNAPSVDTFPKEASASIKYGPQSRKWGWKKTLGIGALCGSVLTIGRIMVDERTLGQMAPQAVNETEVLFFIGGQIIGAAIAGMLLASIITFIRNLFVK